MEMATLALGVFLILPLLSTCVVQWQWWWDWWRHGGHQWWHRWALVAVVAIIAIVVVEVCVVKAEVNDMIMLMLMSTSITTLHNYFAKSTSHPC